MEYLLKWKNYSERACTWEPEEHLTNCSALVKKFEQSLQKKKAGDEAVRNSKIRARRNRRNSTSSEDTSDAKGLNVS